MFCIKCGREIPKRSKFCPYCGETINSAPAKPPKTPKPKKPRSTKIGGAVLALVLCLLLMLSSAAYIIVPAVKGNAVLDKARDGKGGGSESALSYNTEAIEKKKPDISSLGELAGTKEQAQKLSNEASDFSSAMDAAEASLMGEYTEVTSENLDDFLDDIENTVYDMYFEDVIKDYDVCDTGILVTLDSGAQYFYAPELADVDANGDDAPELYISTYQPCLPSYEGREIWSYMHLVDDAAESIDYEYDVYSFESSANYDTEAVDLESLAAMGQYSVILWHGHGAYSYDIGSMLVTGVPCTEENYQKYAQAIENGSLISGGDTFLITASFVENYFEDGSLFNSIVYLGACSSGRDERLVDAFLSKGAAAVYANDDVIATMYNLEMINAVSEGLCEKNSDGSHLSVSDALEYAQEKVAYEDPYGGYDATVRLFTEQPDFSLDWYKGMMLSDRSIVLTLDSSDSMSGTPIEETKDAAHRFVSSVLGQNAAVGIVSYDYDAMLQLGFSADESVLGSAIDGIRTGGRTNTYAGLATAASLLSTVDSDEKIIVLMSDGMPNEGLTGDDLIEYAQSLKDEGISIYTLGFFQDLYSSDKYEAQQLMEALASDGCHYEVADADDLQFFFGDIADQVNGQRYIYIRIACPVDVTVKYKGEKLCSEEDSLSTRTSFGSLSFENTEDGDDTVKVLRLKEGALYDIKIEGNASGSMDYTVGYMDENGEYTDFRRFEDIDVGRRTVIDTVAGNMGDTTLSVDSDGDGSYDEVYTASENGEGKPLDRTLTYVAFGVCCASLLGAVISTVIIVVRVKRRKAAA